MGQSVFASTFVNPFEAGDQDLTIPILLAMDKA
jgi:hypothetical protein